MPGGFFAGLGQGLQNASRTVGQHFDQRQEMNRLEEQKRQFGLAQQLANDQFAHAKNQAGVVNQHADATLMQGNERNAIARTGMENDVSQANADRGMQYLNIDAAQRQRDLMNPSEINVNNAQAQYYRSGGSGGGETERYYKAQRIAQLMAPIERQLAKEQDPIASFSDPDGGAARRERIKQLRMQMDQLFQSGASGLGIEFPALQQALDGNGFQLPSTPGPNTISGLSDLVPRR